MTPELCYLDFEKEGFSTKSEDVKAAREHWCARTPYGYAVLSHHHVGHLLRDKRLRQGSYAWPEKQQRVVLQNSGSVALSRRKGRITKGSVFWQQRRSQRTLFLRLCPSLTLLHRICAYPLRRSESASFKLNLQCHLQGRRFVFCLIYPDLSGVLLPHGQARWALQWG